VFRKTRQRDITWNAVGGRRMYKGGMWRRNRRVSGGGGARVICMMTEVALRWR
jgi:hypothetical protein